MSRDSEFETLYAAYQEFVQTCLLEDRSLLWPDRALWTKANVSTLRHILLDTPAYGKESFEEKLVIQLADQPPELWGLLADIYYLYCLVPKARFMKSSTKQDGIVKLAQKGRLPVPDAQANVWNVMESGFCAPGQRFMQKYRQFWLIIICADEIKRASNRNVLLKDRQQTQNLLDFCLEKVSSPADRGTDMRHALLYLAYPDYYESIVSTGDKKRIVEGFRSRISGEVPADYDAALYQIRQVLENDESISKPLHFYNPHIKPLWKNIEPSSESEGIFPPPPIESTGVVLELIRLFKFTKNIIIYGPPGTGKTYIANQTAYELVKDQLEGPVTESMLLQDAVEANTFYDVLALGFYLSDKKKHYTVKEIREIPLIQARFRSHPINNENENLWARLQEHTSPNSKTVNVARKVEPFLFEKDDYGKWYLTESGAEYVEQTLSDSLELLQQTVKEGIKAEDFITRVAFHQSYAYEDFVEGFRPVGKEEIEIVPGKFREVCAQATANPAANYVLIIDEINRGNISKIFGELITLLEDDKRDGQPSSFPIELSYSHIKFKVPGNLYIIGTMNTADRSIALLDVALRRRFAFYELLPDPELLHGMVIKNEDGDQVDLEMLLKTLNQRISKELGPDYRIGHSYFMKVDSLEALEFAWNHQILPLLREYFYSQPERLMEVIGPYLKDQENTDDFRREGDDLLVALSELEK